MTYNNENIIMKMPAGFYEKNINQLGIEVKLTKDFNLISETLERIGIINQSTKIVTPSCYLIYRNDKYFLCHFKELLSLDGYEKRVDEIDYLRRNKIATMIMNWNMFEIVDNDFYVQPDSDCDIKIYVLTHKKKSEYTINHKFIVKKNNFDKEYNGICEY